MSNSGRVCDRRMIRAYRLGSVGFGSVRLGGCLVRLVVGGCRFRAGGGSELCGGSEPAGRVIFVLGWRVGLAG